jgi:hypothetical protein
MIKLDELEGTRALIVGCRIEEPALRHTSHEHRIACSRAERWVSSAASDWRSQASGLDGQTGITWVRSGMSKLANTTRNGTGCSLPVSLPQVRISAGTAPEPL